MFELVLDYFENGKRDEKLTDEDIFMYSSICGLYIANKRSIIRNTSDWFREISHIMYNLTVTSKCENNFIFVNYNFYLNQYIEVRLMLNINDEMNKAKFILKNYDEYIRKLRFFPEDSYCSNFIFPIPLVISDNNFIYFNGDICSNILAFPSSLHYQMVKQTIDCLGQYCTEEDISENYKKMVSLFKKII